MQNFEVLLFLLWRFRCLNEAFVFFLLEYQKGEPWRSFWKLRESASVDCLEYVPAKFAQPECLVIWRKCEREEGQIPIV